MPAHLLLPEKITIGKKDKADFLQAVASLPVGDADSITKAHVQGLLPAKYNAKPITDELVNAIKELWRSGQEKALTALRKPISDPRKMLEALDTDGRIKPGKIITIKLNQAGQEIVGRESVTGKVIQAELPLWAKNELGAVVRGEDVYRTKLIGHDAQYIPQQGIALSIEAIPDPIRFSPQGVATKIASITIQEDVQAS